MASLDDETRQIKRDAWKRQIDLNEMKAGRDRFYGRRLPVKTPGNNSKFKIMMWAGLIIIGLLSYLVL